MPGEVVRDELSSLRERLNNSNQTQPTAIVSGAPQAVALNDLLPADSPRSAGEDMVHVRAMAQSEAVLPPTLVHRATMRFIDGMHRLRAAEMRGMTTIDVQFFDGNDDVAFVISVEANTAHGLPLTLADREAAAQRILRSHGHWSDRAIASVTGLSAKTVASLPRLHDMCRIPWLAAMTPVALDEMVKRLLHGLCSRI